jgi:hypothetical protein
VENVEVYWLLEKGFEFSILNQRALVKRIEALDLNFLQKVAA